MNDQLYRYTRHPDCPNGVHEQQPHTYGCRHCSAVNMWHVATKAEPGYIANVLRRELPLISDEQVRRVVAALGVEDE